MIKNQIIAEIILTYKKYNFLRFDIISKDKPWKTKVERDIIMHEDLKESGLQGGKIIGQNLALLSFIIGIPLLFIGSFAIINMVFDMGIEPNNAIIILTILITIIGFLMTLGGYFLYKDNSR